MFESKKARRKEITFQISKYASKKKSGLYYVSTLVPGVGFCTPPTPGKKWLHQPYNSFDT